jgi:hypothetical protein
MLVSESPFSAKNLMVLGIKFKLFLENGGRHKTSKLETKFGNKKGRKLLMISLAADKS